MKPDPSDYRTDPKLVQGYYDPRQTEYYYQDQEGYIRPDISFESTHDLYTQAQLQRAQEINLQQHYQLQDIDRSLAAMNEESPGEKWPPNINQQQVFTPRGPQTPNHHHQQLQQDKSELRVSYEAMRDPIRHNLHPLILCFFNTTEQIQCFPPPTDVGNVRRGLTEPYTRRTSLAVNSVATTEQQYGTLDRAVLHKYTRYSGCFQVFDFVFLSRKKLRFAELFAIHLLWWEANPNRRSFLGIQSQFY